MAVFFTRRGPVPVTAPPVGTTWLYEEDGTFTVPATGSYQIEMHGGGGGGGFGSITYDMTWASTVYQGGGGGGGSGEIITASLIKNTSYGITIGGGGARATDIGVAAADGGTTIFGDYSVAGGKGGITRTRTNKSGGSASGSLATSGGNGQYQSYGASGGAGGYGNKNNTGQTYGNGGKGGGGGSNMVDNLGVSGNPGAVIITYLGKE